jgi:signal peptidase I
MLLRDAQPVAALVVHVKRLSDQQVKALRGAPSQLALMRPRFVAHTVPNRYKGAEVGAPLSELQRPMRVTTAEQKRKEGGFAETVRVVIHALIIAVVIRTFLFQPFNIPSGSMMATLLIGDYLFVSKYTYGYSRYSFPFSPPLFSGRIFGSGPQRGDVVVFRLPRDDSTDYIKRVIGLPGDRIQMIDGVLQINGQAVKKERAEDYVGTEDGPGVKRIKRYKETLPNGVIYYTLDLTENSFYDNTPVYNVPADHYFMMGDNRDNSTDSRVLSQVGYVPIDNIVGRAEIIFFSVGDGEAAWKIWRWPWVVRWSRLFSIVR